MVMGDTAHALVVHPDLTVGEITDAIRCWPTVTMVTDLAAMPTDDLTIEDVVALAAARRSIEPLRFYVGPTGADQLAPPPRWVEAMPVLIG